MRTIIVERNKQYKLENVVVQSWGEQCPYFLSKSVQWQSIAVVKRPRLSNEHVWLEHSPTSWLNWWDSDRKHCNFAYMMGIHVWNLPELAIPSHFTLVMDSMVTLAVITLTQLEPCTQWWVMCTSYTILVLGAHTEIRPLRHISRSSNKLIKG